MIAEEVHGGVGGVLEAHAQGLGQMHCETVRGPASTPEGRCARHDQRRPRVYEPYRCELLKTLTARTRTLAERLDIVHQVREVGQAQ